MSVVSASITEVAHRTSDRTCPVRPHTVGVKAAEATTAAVA